MRVLSSNTTGTLIFAGFKKSAERLEVDQYLQTHYVNEDGAHHGESVSPRLLSRAMVSTIYKGVEVTDVHVKRLAGLIEKAAKALKIPLMTHRESLQTFWGNDSISADARAAVGKRKKTEWAALTVEEQNRRMQPLHQYHAHMTPEERAVWATECRDRVQARLAAMTDEERAEYSRRLSEAARAQWAAMNPAERAAQIEASRQGQLQYWAGLSDEEREARAVVLRQRWADMSDEERTAVGDAISEAQTARWEGMDDETYQAFCDNARELFWAQPEEVRLRMLAAMTAREQQGN